MNEENEKIEEDAVVKAVREEYEKKLADQQKAFEEDKRKALEEAEEKHIKQIRALLSGEGHIPREDNEPVVKEPESREEILYDDLKDRFNLK